MRRILWAVVGSLLDGCSGTSTSQLQVGRDGGADAQDVTPDRNPGTLETYRRGLSTLIDLLTAERELASARSTAIDSRAQLLTAAAALTFAVGG